MRVYVDCGRIKLKVIKANKKFRLTFNLIKKRERERKEITLLFLFRSLFLGPTHLPLSLSLVILLGPQGNKGV